MSAPPPELNILKLKHVTANASLDQGSFASFSSTRISARRHGNYERKLTHPVPIDRFTQQQRKSKLPQLIHVLRNCNKVVAVAACTVLLCL
jgi:hypothetical protein